MTFPQYRTLKVESKGESILVATLDRPEVLNAINTQMGHDQLDLWSRLTAEPGQVRCVVLTGAFRALAVRITVAAAVSAANPFIGRRRMILCPIVFMIRHPPDAVPSAIANAQLTITHVGM